MARALASAERHIVSKSWVPTTPLVPRTTTALPDARNGNAPPFDHVPAFRRIHREIPPVFAKAILSLVLVNVRFENWCASERLRSMFGTTGAIVRRS